MKPDVSTDELQVLCKEFYQHEVVVTTMEIKQIEELTRSQSDNNLWFQQRKKRLTASSFDVVARRRKITPVANLVKMLLYSKPACTMALRWGRDHENDARIAYIKWLRSDNIHTAQLTRMYLLHY